MFDIELVSGLFIEATEEKTTPTEYVTSRLRPRLDGKVVSKAEQVQAEWRKRLRQRGSDGKVLKPLSKKDISNELYRATGITTEQQNTVFFSLKLFMENNNQESIDLKTLVTSSSRKPRKSFG